MSPPAVASPRHQGSRHKTMHSISHGWRGQLAVALLTALFTVSLIELTSSSHHSSSQLPIQHQSLSFNTQHPTFSAIAANSLPTTDKITDHKYQRIYDQYFGPEVQSKPIKFLEIGLGCDMKYGPGASSKVWTQLLPKAEIWFAEYDAACVAQYWNKNLGWKVVTGDQADPKVLEQWLKTTGGNFDYIIDDGGHTNIQIWNSFQHLFFTALKPGGVYFIEDLHVSRFQHYYAGGVDGKNDVTVPEILAGWIEQILMGQFVKDYNFIGTKQWQYALPGIDRIDCIAEMCAITKSMD